jgi:hypothetical protein
MKKLHTIWQVANAVARQYRCGTADSYMICSTNGLAEHTHYGYRKCTTGEYVPNAYLANFGWKNTYYQGAWTKVRVCQDYAAKRLWGIESAGTMAGLV